MIRCVFKYLFNVLLLSKAAKSLIWTVVNERNVVPRFDKIGRLIFDTSNPTHIIFECQINSPCGHIPITARHPSGCFVLLYD